MQETPEGYEIPVPKKSDVFRDLTATAFVGPGSPS